MFQRIIIDAEAALRTPEADAVDDELVEGAVLTAQKVALADAARRGLIASDTADRAIAEIDRRLLRRDTGSENEDAGSLTGKES